MVAIRSFALIAICASCISQAQAANGFSEKSDILGLSVSMNKAEIAKVVADKFPGVRVVDFSTTIINQDYNQTISLGLGLDIMPDGMKVPPADGAGVDRLRVFYDPNQGSDKVVAVTRYTHYSFDAKLTITSLEGSLIEKYGPPKETYSYTSGGKEFLWAADPGFNKRSCVTASNGLNSAYLFESANTLSFDPNMMSNGVGTAFLDKVNGMNYPFISAPMHKVENCGTVLIVVAVVGNGYVTSLDQREVDVSHGIAALFKFKSDFTAHSEQNKEQRLNNDSKNKAKL